MTKRKPRIPRLPAAPLLALVPRAPDAPGMGYASLGGVHSLLSDRLQRAIYRARASGALTYSMADELAVALGYHPVEIWPEWFA